MGNGPTYLFPLHDGTGVVSKTGTLLPNGLGTAVSGALAAVFGIMTAFWPAIVQ